MEQLLETTRTVIGRMTVFGAAFNVSTVLKNTRDPRASQSGPSLAASSPTSASAMRSGASGTRAKIERPIPKGDESDVEFIADDTDTKEAGVVDANDNNSLRPSEGMSMLSESQATSRRESVLSADVPKKKKKSKKKGRPMKHDENGNKVPLTDQEVKEYMNYVNSLGKIKRKVLPVTQRHHKATSPWQRIAGSDEEDKNVINYSDTTNE